MISIIVAGRNDDYGADFRDRLFRTALHNSAKLEAAGVCFEYLLAEWNPLPGRPRLCEEFVRKVPASRAVVIPPSVHERYSLNPRMPFHEMAAKNAALRRARGETIIVTNADILFGDRVVQRIAGGGWSPHVLYRAHRIDVGPALSFDEMQDPQNQLPSGEGILAPVYYLGAGGDFCLARREAWHTLRGFNERIRFSTRAKDWQFYLSASLLGFEIEFIGDVYHLDHAGGFRNTDRAGQRSEDVHFGTWWDIEFGLPVSNPEDWGFARLPEETSTEDPRIVTLQGAGYRVPEKQEREDRDLHEWLAPAAATDLRSALICHSIASAHRAQTRLICRLQDIRTAVALSGMGAVAARLSLPLFCNWRWPALSGLNVRGFHPEPDDARPADWLLEESADGFRVTERGTARPVDVLPHKWKVREPEFNPVLVRRLLRAFLWMQEREIRRVAIFGAGGHTSELLRWGWPDDIQLVGIVTSAGAGGVFQGLPVVSLPDLKFLWPDAVVLSSCSYEPEMAVAAEGAGVATVVRLYGDWPTPAPGFWLEKVAFAGAGTPGRDVRPVAPGTQGFEEA